jgi:ABC-type multidrug transport system ATPase subunit
MKGKKTIILVTHQISYLYDCDSVIIMEDGRILDHDTPNNLK